MKKNEGKEEKMREKWREKRGKKEEEKKWIHWKIRFNASWHHINKPEKWKKTEFKDMHNGKKTWKNEHRWFEEVEFESYEWHLP